MFIEDKEAYIDYALTDIEPTHIAVECDNLEYLKYMRDTKQKVNLVFTDIPFNAQKKSRNFQFSYQDYLDTDVYLQQLRERFTIVREIMTPDAILFLKINHVSLFEVGLLLDDIFGKNERMILVWKKASGHLAAKFVKDIHEYILLYSRSKKDAKYFSRIDNDNVDFSKLEYDEKEEDGETQRIFYSWIKPENSQSRYSSKNDYKYITRNGIAVYPNGDKEAFEKRQKMTEEEIRKSGIAYSFNLTKEAIYQKEVNNEIKVDGNGRLLVKGNRNKEKVASNYIEGKGMTYNSSQNFLQNILPEAHFTYPTPIPLISYLIQLSNIRDGVILDLYGGSGSTGVAVLETNKKLNLKNKFILLQNNENDIFNNVTYKVLKRSSKGYRANNGKLIKGLKANIKIFRWKK